MNYGDQLRRSQAQYSEELEARTERDADIADRIRDLSNAELLNLIGHASTLAKLTLQERDGSATAREIVRFTQAHIYID